jgi:hypothetical protein
MTLKVHLPLIAIAFLFSGCAGYSAAPIYDVESDEKADGVRYYEPALYLLVYSDGRGNLTSQILTMPDTSKKMVVNLHAFAAKNNSTLTFNNGILTSSKMELDSTAIPSKIINTIQTLGTAAISSAFNSPQAGSTRTIPAPYLFKIVVDNNGTRLVGGQGVGADNKPITVQVSVTKEAAAITGNADAGTPSAETAQ